MTYGWTIDHTAHTVDQANYNLITQPSFFLLSLRSTPITSPVTPKMPSKKYLPNRGGDAFLLVWVNAMIDEFLQLLEEANENGKRSDAGFKPEAWVGF